MQYNYVMKLAYQFKLLPTYEQQCRMSKWLDMLRHQYNFLLADRFDWYEMNKCPANACPLVCSMALPREQPEYYGQKRSTIPDGCLIKRALVTLKADGWYVTLTLEDKSVPDNPTIDIEPTEANSIGVDAGLEYFVACSDGTMVEPPKFYRQAEEKLAKLQAKQQLRKKGSTARRKLGSRIAKLHQQIARQRKQWHFERADELVNKAEVIFVEDLKVSNMTRRNKPKQDNEGNYIANGQAQKSGLNKSFADAGIAGFLNEILPYKAAKAGRLVKKVNPAGTSQHCAICLSRVPKKLSDRWHECSCGASMPRDLNSGILIKKVGLGVRLTIKRESGKSRRRSPHSNL